VIRVLSAACLAFLSCTVLAAEAPPKKAEPKAKEEEKPKPGSYAHLKTAKGEIVVRLLADEAPATVKNFVELAKGERPWKDKKGRWVAKPFYNGLTFHRIENGDLKLIQGGCPKGDGTGGPGYKFDDEGLDKLKFDKPGLVAMANSGPDTNGSQFFITLAMAPALSGKYTIFGEVVAGLEVVRAISEMPATEQGSGASAIHLAKEPVAIQSVRIEEVK